MRVADGVVFYGFCMFNVMMKCVRSPVEGERENSECWRGGEAYKYAV